MVDIFRKDARLRKAIKNGDRSKAIELIVKGAYPDNEMFQDVITGNMGTPWMQTLLDAGTVPSPQVIHLAVLYEKMEMAGLMIGAGAMPSDGTLDYLISARSPAQLKRLVDAMATKGKKPSSRTLVLAMDKKDLDIAKVLVAAGVVADEKMLEHAVKNLNSAWVKLLLDAGVQPTSRMLFITVVQQKMDTAKLLVAAGAFPDKSTQRDAANRLDAEWVALLKKATDALTPQMLWEAIDTDTRRAEALMDAGVIPDERTLAFAVENDWPEVVEMMLAAGAQPTPAMLYDAVSREDWSMALVLAKHVVPNEKTLDYAVSELDPEWVTMLIEAGGKPTPDMLFIAVNNEYMRMANTLIAGHVVPNEKTLDYAVANMDAEWVQRLIAAKGVPTPEMLYIAVSNENWGIAEALIAGHVVPDRRTLAYAADNLETDWTDLLVKAANDNKKAVAFNKTAVRDTEPVAPEAPPEKPKPRLILRKPAGG